MREIEVKARVKNLDELADRLTAQGVALSEPIYQHDTIYSYGTGKEIWESSKEGHIVVRLRRQDKQAEFNLKQQRSNELDNLEYETAVSNPEAMHQILLVMGYRPQVEVKKVRRRGKLGEYGICLDEVQGLGSFVELEKLTDETVSPEIIQTELWAVLESFGLARADEEKKGYDTQIYELRSFA